jgi:CRP-like cAMP-binding protein
MTKTVDRLEKLVAKQPFLSILNPRFRQYFTDCAMLQHIDKGQEIFHQDGPADHFYLVLAGRVGLETFVPGCGMVTIQTLGPGEALGWSWLFPPRLWHFSSSALEPTDLIAFDAAYLRDKAEKNRDFAIELVNRMAGVLLQRLQGTRTQLIDLYSMRP